MYGSPIRDNRAPQERTANMRSLQRQISGDEESGSNAITVFEDVHVRHQFIRMVYTILFIQLALTAGIILLFRLLPTVCIFVLTTPAFWYSCLALSIVLVCAISCCEKARHVFPVNLILLGLFTIVEGVLLGGVTCIGKTDAVLMAVGITGVVCLVLTIFACQTRCDFTICSGIMLVFIVILLITGIVAIFVRDRILHIVYGALGTLVFSVYLIIDTQLIMGGNHRYSLEPNEYILGALHLYLDIVMIFLYLYTLITAAQS